MLSEEEPVRAAAASTSWRKVSGPARTMRATEQRSVGFRAHQQSPQIEKHGHQALTLGDDQHGGLRLGERSEELDEGGRAVEGTSPVFDGGRLDDGVEAVENDLDGFELELAQEVLEGGEEVGAAKLRSRGWRCAREEKKLDTYLENSRRVEEHVALQDAEADRQDVGSGGEQ